MFRMDWRNLLNHSDWDGWIKKWKNAKNAIVWKHDRCLEDGKIKKWMATGFVTGLEKSWNQKDRRFGVEKGWMMDFYNM